jgi:hypothetical protein
MMTMSQQLALLESQVILAARMLVWVGWVA